MSTSFLQHLLVKHNEKDESESQGSSERDSLSALSASPTSLPLMPPSRDQGVTIAQLLHYIHGLVVGTINVDVGFSFCLYPIINI